MNEGQNPYSHLDASAFRIAYLIAGYIRQTLTEKEHDELDDWINADDKNMQLFEELTDERNLEANLAWMDQVQSQKSYDEHKQAGKFQLPTKKFTISPAWAAAASLVLLVALFFIYRYAARPGSDKNPPLVIEDNELLPGSDKATIRLEDGRVIDLSTIENKDTTFSHVGFVVANGLVEYEADAVQSSAFHTLTTPAGGQYQLKLPDGTKVWLNAATELKYPVAFAGKERVVELDGEAYFEVAKNASQPFKVMLNDSSEVQVLGTHFNVMSYQNENAKEITLLEGSVRVSRLTSHDSRLLSPGQQALIYSLSGGDKVGASHVSRLTIHDNIDTSEITGWKDGLFVFHDAPIESIMRQVERWYGAKVVYQGKNTQLFNATIQRKEPLSKLLHLLEVNGYVHFKVENKTIYVLP
jgi:transmembrane sensor